MWLVNSLVSWDVVDAVIASVTVMVDITAICWQPLLDMTTEPSTLAKKKVEKRPGIYAKNSCLLLLFAPQLHRSTRFLFRGQNLGFLFSGELENIEMFWK